MSTEDEERYTKLRQDRLDTEKALRSSKLKLAKARTADAKALLKKIRPMGIDVEKVGHEQVVYSHTKKNKAAADSVRESLADVPSDWITKLSSHHLVGIGVIQHADSPYDLGQYHNGTITLARPNVSVAAHEVMHAVEASNPRVVEMQRDYFRHRTANEDIKPMNQYGDGVRGKRDKFADPYFGRGYNHGALEVLSMGMEGVMHGKYNLWKRDPETADFVLGLLAAG